MNKKTPHLNSDFTQAMLEDRVSPLKSPLRYQKPTPEGFTKRTSEHLQKPLLELTAESQEAFSFVKHDLDKRLLKKLKKTTYFDSTLDLHGLNKRDATDYLLNEINYYTNQQAILKIIHGKSAVANSSPILKSMTKSLLTEHTRIIAFCSAPLNQGGLGATFALLKP